MVTREGLFYVLNAVLDRYINIMNKTYFSNPDMLPTITKDAEKEFEQLSGYNQIIKDNKNKMLEIKTTVSILGEIKDAVDKLNTELETNKKTEEQYEEALKFQINTFGRLSANMVNGDDIAAANDLAQQIVLKKDHIYKNLLKGPYGCEADLEKIGSSLPFPSAGGAIGQASDDWKNYNVNSVKRMTYPFPIIYDYNEIPAGTKIPDPWNSGYDENKLPKMPTERKYDKYGPGFLSFVYFATSYASNNDNTYSGSERLQLGDLIYNHNSGGQGGEHVFDWVSLGKSGNIERSTQSKNGKTFTNDFQRGGGLFEKTIGVY
jgi:hypothetical protein